jgi:hypothetical protein
MTLLLPKALLPDVRARLRERFIFNYAIPPRALEARLPSWLSPQLVNGRAIASFCILHLDEISVSAWPSRLGVSGLHGAHRFGVVDRSSRPAVYVEERLAGSPWAAAVTRTGFPGRHAPVMIEVARAETGEARSIRVARPDGALVFAARLATGGAALAPVAPVFPTAEDFARFLREGTVSYAPSIDPERLNRVDLAKEENAYAELEVAAIEDPVIEELTGAPASESFVGAWRTSGGRYVWSYRGAVPAR